MNNKPKNTKDEIVKKALAIIKKHNIVHHTDIYKYTSFSIHYERTYKLSKHPEIDKALKDNLLKIQKYNKEKNAELLKEKSKEALLILRETTIKKKTDKETGKVIITENRANALIFRQDFLATKLNISMKTYLEYGLNEDDEINMELEFNRAQIKMKKYADLIKNTDLGSCAALIKLTGTKEERQKLSLKTDVTTDDEPIKYDVTLTPEEIIKYHKMLEKLV